MSPTPFSLCVYCGSRAGHDPAYLDAANQLGRTIANEGWRLVYGAGDVGLMGAAAEAATAAGAPTLGVIPTHLLDAEAPHGVFGDRVVTETMHERKKVMFMNADAVAVLPGGAGSLDEFFEVLTWAQIGLHEKPIFLLDVNGYWQPLIALIDHVIAEGFANDTLRGLFQPVPTVAALAEAVRAARSSASAIHE
ncbi:MAG: TIGR00730 family Rossman fold protein [Silicimonas sp.]|nr:TIGR00730 family Rossman fold protein [Silicimonas sp.]NNF91398.1 TIGR00730 family Rossman fold protein [Boseongicola sp.]RZW12488.1 MAG: TIGR00730 family Rossman fold protein [Paracoccaceae bacterium]NND17991.1 TIGR00730 family Rossman fold protein [Silicimonas sp.]NNL34579.1 TIGR00730 family Rossman fold protein [Silicimonas sp.]